MTRYQKAMLLVFALLDVAVFVLLGGIALKSMQPPPPTPFIQAYIEPCPQTVLEALPETLEPRLAWNETELNLGIQVVYTMTTSQDTSAQYLWTVLDAVADSLRAGCTPPTTLTLAVTVQATEKAYRHIARLNGLDVLDWTKGNVSDEELAARATYRRVQDLGQDSQDLQD
ncbi:MAG: hypothetical protein JW981_04615 [Anaerolineae bacterium]|nr:hypothetical protein [Anaerolineae bacterium]